MILQLLSCKRSKWPKFTLNFGSCYLNIVIFLQKIQVTEIYSISRTLSLILNTHQSQSLPVFGIVSFSKYSFIFNNVCSTHESWKEPDKCRDFLRFHGSNFRVVDRRVLIELKKPWHIFTELPSALSQTGVNEALSFQDEFWLRDLDSNQDDSFQRAASYH